MQCFGVKLLISPLCVMTQHMHMISYMSSATPLFSVRRAGRHTKLSSMLEHSRKESTSRGLISCWWSAASMLSGHPAASLLKAAWRHTRTYQYACAQTQKNTQTYTLSHIKSMMCSQTCTTWEAKL